MKVTGFLIVNCKLLIIIFLYKIRSMVINNLSQIMNLDFTFINFD